MKNRSILVAVIFAIAIIALFTVCASDHIPNSGFIAAPTELVGGAYSSSAIILNWLDNSDNELGFDIYRAGASWVKVGNVAEDVTSWNDHGLQDTTLYRYYVEAIGQTQNSEKSNVLSIYTRSIGHPPNPPSNPIPFNGIDTTVTQLQLSWECSDPDTDFITYDLYFGLETTPPLRMADLQAPTHLIQYFLPDTVYYWQVVAKDDHHHEVAGQIWYFRNVGP